MDKHRNGTETDFLEDLKKLVKSRNNKNSDEVKLRGKEDKDKPTWAQQAKEGHKKAEERKPARMDSEAEKAKQQPKWWRKRRLDKPKWGKDDVMEAGEVEMALADRGPVGKSGCGEHGGSERNEEAGSAAQHPEALLAGPERSTGVGVQ